MSIIQDYSKWKVYTEPAEARTTGNYFSKNVVLSYYDTVKNVTDLTRFPMQYLETHRPSLERKFSAFYDFFVNTSSVREIDTDRVEWKLKSHSFFKATSAENLHPELTQPGIGGSKFSISIKGFGGFTVPDVIYPELSPESPVLITGNGLPDGAGNTIYEVQIAYGTERDWFDPRLLAAGLRWCKRGAIHGEASGLYGSFSMSSDSYLQFESGLMSLNQKVQVTDKAHRVNLAMRRVNEAGQFIDQPKDARIISEIEARFLESIRELKGKTLWMSRASYSQGQSPAVSRLVDQSSGFPMDSAAGIQEFLEDGNVIEYPVDNFSIDMIIDYANQLWFDSVPWANRKIVFYTGTGGLQLWESAIAEKFHGYGAHIPFEKVAKPTQAGNVPGSRVSKYTFSAPNFTEYELFPGGVVTIAYLPVLDSRELSSGRVHPRTGLPLSSYEFIALDYGIEEGGPNVELLHRRDSEALFYKCGAYTPVGSPNTSMGGVFKGFPITHEHSYYELFYKDVFGVIVRNIKRTMYLKPAVI